VCPKADAQEYGGETMMKFETAWPLINTIPGWMEKDECEFLFETAKTCRGQGVIVEIGTYLGRSTSALCLGTLASEKYGRVSPVYTIDTHHGIEPSECNVTYSEFMAYMKKLNLMSVVKPIVNTSEKANDKWTTPIKFLFIDGDHSFKSVSQDYEMWSPYVTKGGVIALHDTVSWHGPKKLVQKKWKNKKIIKVGEISAIIV